MRLKTILPPRPARISLVGLLGVLGLASVQAQTGETSSATPLSSSSSLLGWFDGPSWLDDTGKPLQWGKISVQPSLGYSFSHSDGEPTRSTGERRSTNTQRVSPSVSVRFGQQWSLNYTPTWTWYSSGRFSQKVNHRANLGGTFRAGITSFSVRQSYTLTDQVELETGRQTELTSWQTSATGFVPVRQQIGIQVTGSHGYRQAASLSTSNDWRGTLAVVTQPFPKVSTSVGTSFGKTDYTQGFDQKSVRYYIAGSWSATNKLSFSGSVGHSSRESSAPGAVETTGATYEGSAFYQVLPHTSLSAGVSKVFGGSLVATRLTEVERATFGIGQRLLGRFNLDVTYSVGTTKYLNPVSAIANRSDDTSRLAASLSTKLTGKLSARIFYRRTENKSETSDFAVNNRQYGAGLDYRF